MSSWSYHLRRAYEASYSLTQYHLNGNSSGAKGFVIYISGKERGNHRGHQAATPNPKAGSRTSRKDRDKFSAWRDCVSVPHLPCEESKGRIRDPESGKQRGLRSLCYYYRDAVPPHREL